MKKKKNLSKNRNLSKITVLACFILSLFSTGKAQIITPPNPTEGVCFENKACTLTINAATTSTDYIWSFGPAAAGLDYPSFISEVESSGGTGTYEIAVNPSIGDEDVYFFNIRVVDDVNNDGDEDVGEAYAEELFTLTVTRRPIKIVLVLDKSGSMGWIASGTTKKRWEILKSSIDIFVKEMELFKDTSDIVDIGDSLGLTYFSSSVTQPAATIGNGFITITDPWATRTSSSVVLNEINSKSPGGWTAMGSGLLDAKTKLIPGSTDTTRIILLFTDGEQNVNPQVDAGGTTLAGGTIDLNDGPGNAAGSIKIFTIGTVGAGTLPSVLNAIATSNRGVALTAFTGQESDFTSFFTNQFTNMFKEYSPQLIDYRYGTFTGGGTTVEEFKLNRDVKILVLQVTKLSKSGLEFTVEKDGLDLTDKGFIKYSSFYSFFRIQFPISDDPSITSDGNWKVTFISEETNEYELAILADDHNLDYDCNFDKDQYTVGDPINFTVSLEYLNQPLINATDSVKAYILKPGDDLGNLMATANIDVSDPSGEISLVQQKYLDLIENEDYLQALLPEEQIISLTNNGDGTYSGSFADTEETGVYRVVFKIKGEIPDGGGIYERMEMQSTVLDFGNIDVDATEAEKTIVDNVLNLTFRPKNIFRYFIGPGFSSRINVTVDGTVITDFTDNLDGSYTYKVPGIAPGANPTVKISVMDEVYYDGTLSKFPPKKKSWCLLIILVIVVIVIILRRLKTLGIINKIPEWILYALAIIVIIIIILQRLGILFLC